jgi:SAM-dependent methyltransferase
VDLSRVKQHVPWPAKIAAKLVLSRLPVDYRSWSDRGLFRHGEMDDPSYAWGVVSRHVDRALAAGVAKPFTLLELGPGDSAASAAVSRALGASRVYLVDAGAYARTDLRDWRAVAAFLRDRGLDAPEIGSNATLGSLLDAVNAEYVTDGIDGLRRIPDASVDVVFSHAVLEHVRAGEFEDVQRELRRVLAPGGVASHTVDLRDHLHESLNNLRFPSRLWETGPVHRGGFYTNRIGYDECLAIFARAGFSAEVVDVERWPRVPVPRRALAREFRHRTDEALRIWGFDVLLRPA